MFGASEIHGIVHPTASLEDNIRVEPGAVVGARAEIGRDTVIAAGAVIGEAVAIGRDCSIGANVQHPARAGRQPRDHSSRRLHRAGRLRLRHGSRRAT